MSVQVEGRRVLVLTTDGERQALGEVLQRALLPGWELVEAEGVDRARFLQQLDPCDVVLLDGSLPAGEPAGLRWLTSPYLTPALFLTDAGPDVLQTHLLAGVTHWLPRHLALNHPPLLATVLQQAAQTGDLQRRLRQREEALTQCRRQVNRLVGLLWQTVPVDSRASWFTQRHMLERLQEEVVRSQRHGDPLTVVLGEIADGDRKPVATAENGELATWTALQVSRNKRRCDVAGQYGPHGFMLLLPHTGDKGAADCCRRLRPLLENPRAQPDGVPPLQVTFGIASFSPSTATVNTLLGRAEERLEHARANPADRLAF